ncbi:hypothetical protein ACK8YP_004307 [Salmonella enterica subsp. enterica serovar Panama]
MNRLISAFCITFCCHAYAITLDASITDFAVTFEQHTGHSACVGKFPQGAPPGTFVGCRSDGDFPMFSSFTSKVIITRLPDKVSTSYGGNPPCTVPSLRVRGGLEFAKSTSDAGIVETIDISGMNVGESRTGEIKNAKYIALTPGTVVSLEALQCDHSVGSLFDNISARVSANYSIEIPDSNFSTSVLYEVLAKIDKIGSKPDFTLSPTYVRCVGNTASGCMTEPVTVSVKDVTNGHRIQVTGLVTGGDLSYISNTGRVDLPEGKLTNLVNTVSSGGIQQVTSGRFVIPGGGTEGTRFYTVNYTLTVE